MASNHQPQPAEPRMPAAGPDFPAGNQWMIFRPSPIHGLGAFARQSIPSGIRVLEYKGELIEKRESLNRCELNNPYIFGLNDKFDLDGNVSWNAARFFNHSCAPNCEAVLEQDRIWLVARRDIIAGEELTFNYGFDLEDYRNYPCRCGASNCVGYIVAEQFFDHVRSQTSIDPALTPQPPDLRTTPPAKPARS